MFGKNPHLIALEAQKRVLVAESEINRALLWKEYRSIIVEMEGLTRSAKRLGAIILFGKAISAGVSLFLRNRHPSAAPGRSWVSSIVTGLREGTSIWRAFRRKSE